MPATVRESPAKNKFSNRGVIHREAHQLFALLPTSVADSPQSELLFERYGLHVIPLPTGEPRDALCAGLKRVKRDWSQHRREWLAKPPIRKLEVDKKPYCYRHYKLDSELATHSNARRHSQRSAALQQLLKHLKNRPRVLVIVGSGGSGKSWLAGELLDHLESETDRSFKKLFFWSSYYADDFLSGLERALMFLPGGQANVSTSRLDRLLGCMRKDRYLLVFDGIERLLSERARPGVGVAYNPDVDRFFRRISSDHNSTVILTTRLMPAPFVADVNAPTVEAGATSISHFRMPQLSAEDIEKEEHIFPYILDWASQTAKGGRSPRLSALVGLLQGHRYGLVLANTWLGMQDRDPEDLEILLSDVAPEHRVSHMIGLVIRALPKPEVSLLDRLSIFMSPVSNQVIEKCYSLADPGPKDVAKLEKAVKTLCDCRLMFRALEAPATGKRATRKYTVHPTVRGYVFHRLHHAASDALPNFTLPGHTAGNALVDPGDQASVKMIKGVFQKLCIESDPLKDSRGLDLCRSAFGVIRSRMQWNTARRWDMQNDYLRMLIRLCDLVRNVSDPEGLWNAASQRSHVIKKHGGPLYEDELAWLYNEIGLGFYQEGSVFDALGVWEQGHTINRLIDSIQSGGLYLFQSFCNLGAAFIQFGRLGQAEDYLRQADRVNHHIRDKDHEGRILGYRGLIQHLRGNFGDARRLYLDSLVKLHESGGNARGASIFERHLADLCLSLGDLDQASRRIRNSWARAESARYPDIVAGVRVSQGHLYRAQKKNAAAIEEYTAALAEARKMRLRAVEADALSELSRVALDIGDTQTARLRAIDALRIANKLSLGLRITHGLVVLGRATLKAGERQLAAAYLRRARSLANQQQYWSRAREAEAQMRLLAPGRWQHL